MYKSIFSFICLILLSNILSACSAHGVPSSMVGNWLNQYNIEIEITAEDEIYQIGNGMRLKMYDITECDCQKITLQRYYDPYSTNIYLSPSNQTMEYELTGNTLNLFHQTWKRK